MDSHVVKYFLQFIPIDRVKNLDVINEVDIDGYFKFMCLFDNLPDAYYLLKCPIFFTKPVCSFAIWGLKNDFS